ncbi:MAG: LysR family transcriptional regulator [Pseudomonadota bacterium]
MNIGSLDLNLLRVFDAVMAERHVTRAGDKLYLSQSAVSHALSRLRHALKDDLFIKTPGGVMPTPRAEELAIPVSNALRQLEAALIPAEFDPSKSTRVFRLAAHDYFATVMAAPLAGILAQNAPHCSFRVRPTAGRALEQLDAKEADFAISAFGEVPDRFESVPLIQDAYVCVMSPKHELATKNLTLRRFAKARHLLISPKGDERGFVDQLLAAEGLTRHVAMIINQFSPAGQIVAHSDLMLTLPERLGRKFKQENGLVVKSCPVVSPSTFNETKLVWHHSYGQHPALQWMRDLILEEVTKLN